ncbi:MAG: hypothetical protein F6K55_09700 [Moorea sp. SIO4A3]|nr:hypothetical protein [Moorena sp. SIO4A3]
MTIYPGYDSDGAWSWGARAVKGGHPMSALHQDRDLSRSDSPVNRSGIP